MERETRHPTFRFLAITLVLMVLIVLPFIWMGYGADADAWLIANAAKQLWQTGVYSVSRFPGFPLHEILSAPLVALGGAPLSNSATVLAGLAAVVVWAFIVRRHARYPRLSLVSLAFTPLFLLNLPVTMDYVWSLLFVLLALQASLRSKPVAAGILVGIAAGFRPANLAAIIPLAVMLRLAGLDSKTIQKCGVAAVVTTLVAFLPVFIRYGPVDWITDTFTEMSDVHPLMGKRVLAFGYRSLYALGPLATLTAIALFAVRRVVLVRSVRLRDPIVIGSASGVAVYLVLFFLLPLDRSYLLPAFPFLLLLVDSVATRSWYIVFAACLFNMLVMNPDIIAHDGPSSTLRPALRWGRTIESMQERKDFLRNRQRIAGISLVGKAIVMTGSGVPFSFENSLTEPDSSAFWRGVGKPVFRSTLHTNVCFVESLEPAEMAYVRTGGYLVYCIEGARQRVERLTGFTLEDSEVIVIQ